MQSSTQSGQILGSLAAGLAITLIGGSQALLVGAGAYAGAAFVFAFLPKTPQPAKSTSASDDKQAPRRTLLAVLRSQAGLIPLMIVLSVVNLGFIGPFTVGLPSLVNQTFAEEAYWYGRLVAGVLVTASCILLGAIAAFIALTVAFFVLSGVASSLMNVGLMTLLQGAAPRRFIGRVMSVVSMLTLGLAPVSQALAGVRVAALNGQAVLVIGSLLSIVTAVVMAPLLSRSLHSIQPRQ